MGKGRSDSKTIGACIEPTTRSTDPNMVPHNQGHIKTSWRCVEISDHDREICAPLKKFPVSNRYFVPPEKSRYGAVIDVISKISTDFYKDCKTCGKVRPGFATATITVANMSAVSNNDIYIRFYKTAK